MKAKYKVGQLVELGDGSLGKITGVTARQEGFTYEVSGQTSQVQETFINTAYAPVVHRVQKAKEPEATLAQEKNWDKSAPTKETSLS